MDGVALQRTDTTGVTLMKRREKSSMRLTRIEERLCLWMQEEDETKMEAGCPGIWKKGSKMIARMKRRMISLGDDKEEPYRDKSSNARLFMMWRTLKVDDVRAMKGTMHLLKH